MQPRTPTQRWPAPTRMPPDAPPPAGAEAGGAQDCRLRGPAGGPGVRAALARFATVLPRCAAPHWLLHRAVVLPCMSPHAASAGAFLRTRPPGCARLTKLTAARSRPRRGLLAACGRAGAAAAGGEGSDELVVADSEASEDAAGMGGAASGDEAGSDADGSEGEGSASEDDEDDEEEEDAGADIDEKKEEKEVDQVGGLQRAAVGCCGLLGQAGGGTAQARRPAAACCMGRAGCSGGWQAPRKRSPQADAACCLPLPRASPPPRRPAPRAPARARLPPASAAPPGAPPSCWRCGGPGQGGGTCCDAGLRACCGCSYQHGCAAACPPPALPAPLTQAGACARAGRARPPRRPRAGCGASWRGCAPSCARASWR